MLGVRIDLICEAHLGATSVRSRRWSRRFFQLVDASWHAGQPLLGRFERWLVSLIQLKVFWYGISRDSLRSPVKNLLYFVGYLADGHIYYYHDIPWYQHIFNRVFVLISSQCIQCNWIQSFCFCEGKEFHNKIWMVRKCRNHGSTRWKWQFDICWWIFLDGNKNAGSTLMFSEESCVSWITKIKIQPY